MDNNVREAIKEEIIPDRAEDNYINRDDWFYYRKTRADNPILQYTCPWKNSSKKKFLTFAIGIPFLLYLCFTYLKFNFLFDERLKEPTQSGYFIQFDLLFTYLTTYLTALFSFKWYSYKNRKPDALNELLLTGISRGEIAYAATAWAKYTFWIVAITCYISSLLISMFYYLLIKSSFPDIADFLWRYISLFARIIVLISIFTKSYYLSRGCRTLEFFISLILFLLHIALPPLIVSPTPGIALIFLLYLNNKNNVNLFFIKTIPKNKKPFHKIVWDKLFFWISVDRKKDIYSPESRFYDGIFGIVIPIIALTASYFIPNPFGEQREISLHHNVGDIIIIIYNNSLHWMVIYCYLPVILWGMAALFHFIKYPSSARKSWVNYGLLGGIIVSLIFSLQMLFIPKPIIFSLNFTGVGILCIAPFWSLATYFFAFKTYKKQRENSDYTNKNSDKIFRYLLMLIISVGTGYAIYLAMNPENLPTYHGYAYEISRYLINRFLYTSSLYITLF